MLATEVFPEVDPLFTNVTNLRLVGVVVCWRRPDRRISWPETLAVAKLIVRVMYVEVEIERPIVAREPEKLPAKAMGC
jgi:hypothetical protein